MEGTGYFLKLLTPAIATLKSRRVINGQPFIILDKCQ